MGASTQGEWYFEDFEVGQNVTTMGRTLTETDLVNFIGLGGIYEEIFLNAEFAKNDSLFEGRVVPGLLVLVAAEGLYIHTGCTRHARAFLGLDRLRISAPTYCSDTVHVSLTVDGVRASRSRPETGVVSLLHQVLNQRSVVVMSYASNRLVECRPVDILERGRKL